MTKKNAQLSDEFRNIVVFGRFYIKNSLKMINFKNELSNFE